MKGRVVAIDFGKRRVGLAISDPSRTIARPLETIAVATDAEAVERVVRRIDELAGDDDGLMTIVVGLPQRLDGAPTDTTAAVEQFIGQLRQRTAVPIVTEGETLSSREAESRLAAHERDWRKRKGRLDAAAAAVFLQDYLDRQ